MHKSRTSAKVRADGDVPTASVRRDRAADASAQPSSRSGERAAGRPTPGGAGDDVHVRHGLLFAIALPRPAAGLTWRGARLSDATVARPLDEGELNHNIVFTYRAGETGTTTVVYALTRDETAKAFQARYFKITVF
jgi:hypothetical protein